MLLRTLYANLEINEIRNEHNYYTDAINDELGSKRLTTQLPKTI